MLVKITDLLLFYEVFTLVIYSFVSDNFRRGVHWNVDVIRIQKGIRHLRNKDKNDKTPQYVNTFTLHLIEILGR